MRIDVYPKNSKLLDNHVFTSTVIVIDVLRATTSITMALKNGAEKIIPARDAGEAVDIFSKLNLGDCVMAGERGGLKLPDFQLGNSPLEFTESAVNGKTVIFSTSNGTAAIHNAKSAKNCILGAMINRTAIAKKALSMLDDVIILCAGTDDIIGADDIVAAGAIIDAITKNAVCAIELTDIAFICESLYESYIRGQFKLNKTMHYRHLCELNLLSDIEFSFKTDLTDIVPVYRNGIIEKSC
ncbi:MAG: 2-phosphosulfolactate phosphatase [Clostridia bacterium]